jgi:aminoglycoside phosphotransferase (APT) family kinase protein
MMPDGFAEEILKELVTGHFNVRPDALTFQVIRTGKHNSSYYVKNGEDCFVLRIAPPDDAGFLFYERFMMRQEPTLHHLIRARTDLPVAEIIAYDFTRKKIDRDYLLMRVLPGVPLSEVDNRMKMDLEITLQQTGMYLRQLHQLTAQDCLGERRYGYLGEHAPMQPQPSWWQAFQVMWDKLLEDVVACGGYSQTEAAHLRGLLIKHRNHFDHPVQSRLLHMDIWGQNILVDQSGDVTGLVDFDRALWGDVEIEFAVLDYCGISKPAFWRGYGQARTRSLSANIRRQFYLLYEVQKYIPIRIWRRNDLVDALRYKAYALQLAKALEL